MVEKKYRFGLNDAEVLQSREKYGRNLITPPEDTPWWKLYLEKFKDPIIMILLVATAISLVFGFIHGDFTESVGIIFAVQTAPVKQIRFAAELAITAVCSVRKDSASVLLGSFLAVPVHTVSAPFCLICTLTIKPFASGFNLSGRCG